MQWKRWIFGVLMAGGVALLASCHATGPTFVVDTTADTTDAAPGDGVCDDGTGACSLRAAIMEANALPGVDAVELAVGATYTLGIAGAGEDAAATGDLDIVEGIDLHGAGSTIDAAGLDRVLDVHAPLGLVLISDVTLTGGTAADGAAVRNPLNASLGLKDVRVTANTATAGAPVASAGETLFIDGSTFDANTGTTAGAVHSDDKNLIAGNATLSGNSAASAALVTSGTGTTAIVDSTITANTGGGLAVDAGTTATVTGSIIAGQASGDDCTGTVGSGGHNLESATTCGFAGTGDQQSTDPLLAALADNGGPTPTHLPQPGSPAIDTTPTGSCSTIGVDQRDIPRPQGSGCDTGATEVRTFTVTSGGDTLDATPGDGTCADSTGDCTLRAAIAETNALPGTDHIVVDPSVTAITLTLAGEENANAEGDLDITDGLTIAGNSTTITQTTIERVFDVQSSATSVALRDLTITGGDTTGVGGASGGGIKAAAPMTLERTTVAGNLAGNRNGGGISTSAHLTVVDSTISGNEAPDNGGGINAEGGLILVNSTVSGNTAGSNGGVRLFGQPAEIVHSTIAGNTGTGLSISSSLTLTATIVADNTGNACSGSGTSGGYNVIDDASCAGWWLNGPGDQPSTDPLLGALADNGGPTLTHLPDATGPAAGAVPAGTAGLCDGTIATDQRGTVRPLGLACDAGAVEVLDAPTTLVVDDGGDSTDATPGDAFCDDGTGACTLRAAIMEANALAGAQTVDVGVPAVTLSLTGTGEGGGDLDVTDELVLEGNGATVTQTTSSRVLLVGLGAGSFTASDVTFTGGNQPLSDGGGLYLRAPTTLTGVTVTGNTGKNGGGINISSGGSLTITDSTVSGNTGTDGGGIQGSPVTATNVTISGNTATAGTGGWRAGGSPSTLVHSTVVANSGTLAGNLRANLVSGPLELTASIVADPAAGSNCVDGQFTSGGYNVVEGGTCAGIDPTDVNADPALGSLADNGGSTLTHLPDIATSPAVDLVPSGTSGLCDGTIASDQRGAARPEGPGCDAGAVEVDYVTVDAGGDTVDAVPGDGTCADAGGDCTLRAAIMEANALAGTQYVHVAVPSVTLSLTGTDATGGDLDVTGSLVIEGDGATVTQTASDRVLEATSGVLRLRDLTITGGNATSPGGGLRLANFSVLERVTVTGNATTSGGGGIIHPGPLTLIDSTITGNTAGSNGGGIGVNASLTMTNSTVSGNTTTAGTFAGGGIATGSTGTVTLRSSTVVGNTGSNLRHATANTFDVGGSIIAGAATGSDCAGGGTYTSSGYNIASDATCGFAATGDSNSTSPLLGALADNGGPTLTHLPGVGSPAIDAIPSGTTGLCDGTIAADQRGTARPQGSACDIGSVEQ